MVKTILKTKSLRHPVVINYVSPQDLLLDDQNPRFAGLVSGLTDQAVLKKLREEMRLDELIESIKENGYYNVEPLLVIESDKPGKFIVIEGNRRLAAIKLLLTDEFKLGKEIKEQITTSIPIAVYPDRKSLWTYLGFRHINGPKEWDSYSKAVYALRVNTEYKVPIKDIAEKIGDRNQTVIKMCNGLRVLEQAEKLGLIELKEVDLRRFYFSHLYTILEKSNTKKYLGLPTTNTLLAKNPVSKNKVGNLKVTLDLIFGNKQKSLESVIKSQNPDLKKLDTVLGDKSALKYLLENSNEPAALDTALNFIDKEGFVLNDLAYKALNTLRKLLGVVYKYQGTDDFRNTVKEIGQVLAQIVDIVEKKKK